MPAIRGPLRRTLFKARMVVHEIAALSPPTMRAMGINTVRMARQNRRDRRVEGRDATTVTAGRYLGAAELLLDDVIVGATVAFERATLEVRAGLDSLICLSWGPDSDPVPWAIDPDVDVDGVKVDVRVEESSVRIIAGAMEVSVSDEGVEIFDATSALRYREIAPLRRGSVRIHRRLLGAAERISGYGEQAGAVDLRGTTLRLFNRDPGGAWSRGQSTLYCGIPVSLSRTDDGAVLAFHENPYDATVRISPRSHDGTGHVETRFTGGMVRTWVAIGTPSEVLERYTELTGRHPLPPRWSLGYHHSRWGFGSSEALGDVLDGFASRRIPISALHLDIDYMDGYRVFTVDEEEFGGLEDVAAAAHDQGARLVAIVDPGVRRDPGYDVYDEGIRGGHFVLNEGGSVHEGTLWPGWAVFPDFTRPATRSWWASYYDRLLDKGITGIWHDMNEPTSLTFDGDRTLPRSARHDNEGHGGDHREAHNVYGMMMNRAGFDALAAARPDQRPFLLSRSGWAGLQRHAWTWTADVEATHRGLAQQIPTFLGLGLSGVAYTGSDIGGFSGTPSPELYLRWLELGVFSPFCRTHSILGVAPREPWCWPEETQRRIERLLSLRYRLLPLLYTEAWVTATTGAPLLRPLWFDEPMAADEIAECDDAFMLGSSILFAQVTEIAEATRTVPLPAGTWWRWNAATDERGRLDLCERFAGGTTPVVRSAPGEPIVFLRGGSIVVLDDAWRGEMRPEGGLADDHHAVRPALHVVPADDGTASGVWFDDAGDGFGVSRVDALAFDGTALEWRSEGEWPRPLEVDVVFHARVLGAATVDGADVDPSAISVEGPSTRIRTGAFSRLEVSDPAVSARTP